MTQKLTLQIALMTLIASSLVLVMVVVAGGLAGPAAIDLGQIVPLALASAASLVVMLINPFEQSRR